PPCRAWCRPPAGRRARPPGRPAAPPRERERRFAHVLSWVRPSAVAGRRTGRQCPTEISGRLTEDIPCNERAGRPGLRRRRRALLASRERERPEGRTTHRVLP